MIEISQELIDEAKARIHGYIETSSSRPKREMPLWEAKVHSEAKALFLLGLLSQDEVHAMHLALEQVQEQDISDRHDA